MSTLVQSSHALRNIELTHPKWYEYAPDYIAVCTCGHYSDRCMFKENALMLQEIHEKEHK